MSQHKRFRSMLLLGAALALGLATSTALAAPRPYYTLVEDCDQEEDNCGPRDENDGPGHEQAKGASFIDADGTPWVGVVVMSSKDIPNRAEGPYQCRYYAWKLSPTAAPQRMVDGVLLTNNEGNRPCNHPDLQYAGDGKMLFLFGTNDPNQANVQPYAQVIDAMTGSPLGERTNLGDNIGNDGAGTAQLLRVGDSMATLALPTTYPKRFVYCYNDNGHNADCTVAEINQNNSVTVEDMITEVIDPANIPRPFMVQITTDGKFAVTAAKGDERPPEDGAYVRVIDVANPDNDGDGKLTEQMALMRSDPGRGLYANSPELTLGPTPDTFWAMNITVKQDGDEGNNLKGTSMLYGHVVKFAPDYTLQVMSTKSEAGHYQAHAAMCQSTYGADGVSSGILVESTITNSGPMVITPMYYDPAAADPKLAISEGPSQVTTPWTGDSGELANLYGNNPNTQGRDFVSCIGSVPNPGYALDTGFQKETKTFIAAASYGMMTDDDYKNSMFLTLMPAHTPNQVLPPDDDLPDPDAPDTDGDGTPDPEDETPNGDNGKDKSGGLGGCSTSGSSSSAGLLLLLGALFIARRRRS